MTRIFWTKAGVAALLLATLGAASEEPRPKALTIASPGLWEISGAPGTSGDVKQCVADLAVLTQYEHRKASCTRVVVRDQPSEAVVHYTCPAGGFGQTKLKVMTPRSMRIETQGIAANEPFYYVLQARRTGDCPAG